MKALTRLALLLFLASLCVPRVAAQQAGSWVAFAPAGEDFKVMLPQQPSVKDRQVKFQGLSASGKLYTAKSDTTVYSVWSFKDQEYAATGKHGFDAFLESLNGRMDPSLDIMADLVWESLLKPERDKLGQAADKLAHMTYERELIQPPLVGREYRLRFGSSMTATARQGAVRFFLNGERIYILMALQSAEQLSRDQAAIERFMSSFAAGPKSNQEGFGTGIGGGTGEGIGMGVGPGRSYSGGGGPGPHAEDYNRIFTTREVVQRAAILSRPEPVYTEEARKYGVQGTVIVRAVLASTGEVTGIMAVKRLPHGLTESAISAAKRISFTPAVKDGHKVSQSITIEYNFNLY